MAGVHIVVDSAAALPRNAAQDLAITIVTHRAVVDGRPFHGTDLVDPVFLDALRSASTPPRIEVPAVDDFLEVFERVLGWDVDVVSLHPPRQVSASADAARAAASRLPPGAPLSVVETACCGSALGLAAIHAAQAGIDDRPRAEILTRIAALDARLQLVGVSGDPAYYHRFGGLASEPAAASAAPEPPVMPSEARWVFECRDRAPRSLAPVADLGTALRRLVGEVEARVDPSAALHLGLLSAGADAEAAAVATFLEGRLRPIKVWIAPCDPVLASLVGPGAFGVAFYAD